MADEHYDSRFHGSGHIHSEDFTYLDSKEAEMTRLKDSTKYRRAYGEILVKAWASRMESATPTTAPTADPLEIKANEGTKNVK
ncbi:MAG: hypothetical protein U9R08_02655 [Nanoarchaeota archaeon]|nr:hypothetical protein [Nanoarchaeota archaeon]